MDLYRKIRAGFDKERSVISQFRKVGAISVELAKDKSEIGEFNRSVFNKLNRKGVIEAGGGGTFFLNEQVLMKHRLERVKWGMILLFIFLIITVLVIQL